MSSGAQMEGAASPDHELQGDELIDFRDFTQLVYAFGSGNPGTNLQDFLSSLQRTLELLPEAVRQAIQESADADSEPNNSTLLQHFADRSRQLWTANGNTARLLERNAQLHKALVAALRVIREGDDGTAGPQAAIGGREGEPRALGAQQGTEISGPEDDITQSFLGLRPRIKALTFNPLVDHAGGSHYMVGLPKGPAPGVKRFWQQFTSSPRYNRRYRYCSLVFGILRNSCLAPVAKGDREQLGEDLGLPDDAWRGPATQIYRYLHMAFPRRRCRGPNYELERAELEADVNSLCRDAQGLGRQIRRREGDLHVGGDSKLKHGTPLDPSMFEAVSDEQGPGVEPEAHPDWLIDQVIFGELGRVRGDGMIEILAKGQVLLKRPGPEPS